MKKLLFVLVLVASAFALQAQTSFGIKVGYLLPHYGWNFEPLNFGQSTAGFTAGVVVESKWGKFSLQPELNYSVYNDDISENNWYFFSFIELPILAKYYITKGFNVYGGIQFGFPLDAGGGSASYNITKSDISTNILVPIGISYKLPFRLFFDARYSAGISNINKTDLSQFISKVSAFTISVGYCFK